MNIMYIQPGRRQGVWLGVAIVVKCLDAAPRALKIIITVICIISKRKTQCCCFYLKYSNTCYIITMHLYQYIPCIIESFHFLRKVR